MATNRKRRRKRKGRRYDPLPNSIYEVRDVLIDIRESLDTIAASIMGAKSKKR